MISKENFKEVLEILGFKQKGKNFYEKHFKEQNCDLKVDFEKGELIYPEQIKKESNTTSNFSQNENFVVFECVNRLLEKGYKVEHLILEKTWSLGHSGKSGRADISVFDENNENILLIIECKTAGNEYKKARKDLFDDESGKQLFSYAAQARSTKWLDLYASDFDINKNKA
ncbi:type I restriction enzyme HsdR N-terminal domain-containing protein [Campylobacter sp. MIT 99-7217]|uniref:type I restriction enzyme HsdR N-terminal domain-containing protein n=1 Tax=Campylobacter sp. MIT 99-7217 TaxID=535091 RepID=UPI00163B7963|nr:type I restriction enzyme HsdR N-terminal domain-containing protein [Campylobacter sp. MIT 99-7217]